MSVALAKTIPIEAELARRGVRLKRIGRELVGPCCVCGGRDRFAVNIAKEIWNCRGCAKGGDIIDLVQHLDGVDFAKAIEMLTGEQPRVAVKVTPRIKIKPNGGDDDDYERWQHAKATRLWTKRGPMAGSIAERYLREARGINCPLPPTLGFLPPTPEHYPAMIAAFALPEASESGVLAEPQRVDAVHLTLLKSDGGGKAEVAKPKLFVARPLGRPIVLAPIGDRLALAIVEGIEDGLSLCAAFELLGVWAAGSGGGMPALAERVPSYVETVTIWAHPDTTGQNGARELAELLNKRGVEVFIEGMLP